MTLDEIKAVLSALPTPDSAAPPDADARAIESISEYIAREISAHPSIGMPKSLFWYKWRVRDATHIGYMLFVRNWKMVIPYDELIGASSPSSPASS